MWQCVDVPNWPGYRVDSNGVVYGKIGYPLKPDVDARGRKRVTLSRYGETKRFRVSRLVLMTFVGPCPDGMEACHENGDATNNRLCNLRWDTRLANCADKHRHGTQPKARATRRQNLLRTTCGMCGAGTGAGSPSRR